jgi:DNA-binding transcriptional ArsR family regulator
MQIADGGQSADVVGLDVCTTKLVDPDRVVAVRERLVGVEEAGRLADQFKLLSDPTRTRLLYALLEAGELCVCDLAETVGSPESSARLGLRSPVRSCLQNTRHPWPRPYSLPDGTTATGHGVLDFARALTAR